MAKKIFIFPYAGGSSYSFYSFREFLRDVFEICDIEYSGHGRRMNEPLLPDVEAISADIVAQIQEFDAKDFVFWGHSFGTTILYETLCQLAVGGFAMPSHVFVSGNSSPAFCPKKEIAIMTDFELKNKLRKLGGMPQTVLDNNELMEIMLPIIRADITANENYNPNLPLRKFDIKFISFFGTKEKLTMQEKRSWRFLSEKVVTKYELSGEHFFIYEHLESVCNIMKISI